jgi:sec-independent protein translocase protein TatC
MTFGEHIEELRTHLLRALKAMGLVLLLGFVLDGVGYLLDKPWIGIGRPAMQMITSPVREQLKLFYDRRLERLLANRDSGEPTATAITARQPMKFVVSPEELARLRGTSEVPKESMTITVHADPVEVFAVNRRLQDRIRPPDLTTLSIQESMVVYFKVAILASLIIASPIVFWEIWSFVAAGLYPHEKGYIHKYLPLSLGLFLGGVALCQFAVIPKSIGALLWFNEWMDLNPEPRLNEWLSFALLLPLVFGISFQTPLVMVFLERIGVMSAATYWSHWRIAVMVLAVFSALMTPTPDMLTMIFMWAPLCGLYFLGIYLCQFSAKRNEETRLPDEDSLLNV